MNNNKIKILFNQSIKSLSYQYNLEFINDFEDDYDKAEFEIRDLFKLFNIFESPLFNEQNICNCYFFPIEKIEIINKNDVYFPVEFIQQFCLKNIPSPLFPIDIFLSFEYEKNRNVSIISFSDNYTKFLNNNVEINDFKNYLKNYSICFNLNFNLEIKMSNIYANPYKHSKNSDLNPIADINLISYMPFRDIILFCCYRPLLKNVYKNKELYKDDIKNNIESHIPYSSNNNPLFGNKIMKLNIDYDDLKLNKDIYYEIFDKELVDNCEKIRNELIKKETFIPNINLGYYLKFHIISNSFNAKYYLKNTLVKFKSNIFNYKNHFTNINFINSVVEELINIL